MAHESGRPLYYWHREVMVPREVVDSVDGLLDEDGEFNHFGSTYRALLISKIREFFDCVPGMDGLVLTVTESDYSVIHNSRPDRYPPPLVIKHIIAVFAEELNRLGKRFILRSFGSIAQDYEDIMEGARRVDGVYHFEIETKITPYDFSPFMPMNPFLKRTGQFALSAEYDSIGEFLGAGYLPAADPARVIECVRYATSAHVDRHVIRIDRIGHATFNSAQAVNLLAFDRAIKDERATADNIWREWAAAHWPACPDEMVAVMQRGIEVVKQTHFIQGNVIFHAFPIDPTMKWIKACGILSLFKPGFDLSKHTGMWGILAQGHAPTRTLIMLEKDEAVRIADESLARLRTLKARLPQYEFIVAEKAWFNAAWATRLIRAFCECVCAYFDDMDAAHAEHPLLTAAMTRSKPIFESILGRELSLSTAAETTQARLKKCHEYGDQAPQECSLQAAYTKPLWQIIQALPVEYRGEFSKRAEWRALPGIVDAIVCGGVYDDWRVRRYMHASHAPIIDGGPVRLAGNRVFPNGFIECELTAPDSGTFNLVIRGLPEKSHDFMLSLDGAKAVECLLKNGIYKMPIHAKTRLNAKAPVRVLLQKRGAKYPQIQSIAVMK